MTTLERRTAQVDWRFGNGPDADGTFDGYANLWDVTDSYGTRFRPGSFRSGGLDERPYALLFMHNPEAVIGTFMAREDERGLRIEGRFAATSAGQDARALAQMGAASELSVGFIRRGTQEDDDTAITAAELVEVSLITARMASQPGAALVAVRVAEGLLTPDEAGAAARKATAATERRVEMARLTAAAVRHAG